MGFTLIKEIQHSGNIKHFLARLQGLHLNGSISNIEERYGEKINPYNEVNLKPPNNEELYEYQFEVDFIPLSLGLTSTLKIA
jgi:hypothetical protein